MYILKHTECVHPRIRGAYNIHIYCTYLAGVLPVHGVDGWARVHVHEVVVGIAHHPPAPIMELHS